jgi:hypothetical protein
MENKEKRNKRISEKIRQLKRSEEYTKLFRYFMEEDDQDLISKIHADTKKTCSCFLCGNPRKFFGEKTKQEYKMDIDTVEEMEDVDYKFKKLKRKKLYHS